MKQTSTARASTSRASTSRERIIETAITLIDRQGYCATGLNQIVAESNSPKGSLYHYFPDGKEQLVAEAVRSTGEASARWIEARLSEEPDTARAFSGLITGFADHVEALGCCGGGPVAAIALEAGASSERLRRACADTYQQWRELFAHRLTEDGISPPRAEVLALLIQSSIEGAMILSRAAGDASALRVLAGEMTRLVALEGDA